jgi:hypothetical protein
MNDVSWIYLAMWKQKTRRMGISDLLFLLSVQGLKSISICGIAKAFTVSLLAGVNLIRISRIQPLRAEVPSVSEWFMDARQCVFASHKYLDVVNRVLAQVHRRVW